MTRNDPVLVVLAALAALARSGAVRWTRAHGRLGVTLPNNACFELAAGGIRHAPSAASASEGPPRGSARRKAGRDGFRAGNR